MVRYLSRQYQLTTAKINRLSREIQRDFEGIKDDLYNLLDRGEHSYVPFHHIG